LRTGDGRHAGKLGTDEWRHAGKLGTDEWRHAGELGTDEWGEGMGGEVVGQSGWAGVEGL
jgi:hypothetical protein